MRADFNTVARLGFVNIFLASRKYSIKTFPSTITPILKNEGSIARRPRPDPISAPITRHKGHPDRQSE